MSTFDTNNAPMIHCPNLQSFINLYLAFMRGGPNQELASANYIRYLRVKVPRDHKFFQNRDRSVDPDFEGDLYFVVKLTYKPKGSLYDYQVKNGFPMATIYLCTSEFDIFSVRSYYAAKIDNTGTYEDYDIQNNRESMEGSAQYIESLATLVDRARFDEIHQQNLQKKLGVQK